MAASVKRIREELLQVKAEAKAVQSAYKLKAEQRVAYQTKMADLNKMVQSRSRDAMLVEDIIILTLAAETAAQERYSTIPEEPTATPEPVTVGQRTKSAEEATRVYQSQIDYFREEIDYRTEMGMAERDMDLIYRKAVDDILDIMDEYCEDGRLRMEVERFSESGSAPCSPRKRKGVFGKKERVEVDEDSDDDVLPKSPTRPTTASSPRKTMADMNDSMAIGTPFMPPPLTTVDGDGSDKELDEDPLTDDEDERSQDEVSGDEEEEYEADYQEGAESEQDESERQESGFEEDESEIQKEAKPGKLQDEIDADDSEAPVDTAAEFSLDNHSDNDLQDGTVDAPEEKSGNTPEESIEEAEMAQSQSENTPEESIDQAETAESKLENTPEESAEEAEMAQSKIGIPENLEGAYPENALASEEQDAPKKKKKKAKAKKTEEEDSVAVIEEEEMAEDAKPKKKKKKAKKTEESEHNVEAEDCAPEEEKSKKKKKKKAKQTTAEDLPEEAPATKKKKKKATKTADDDEITSEEAATKKKSKKVKPLSEEEAAPAEKKKKKKTKKKGAD